MIGYHYIAAVQIVGEAAHVAMRQKLGSGAIGPAGIYYVDIAAEAV